VCVVSFHWYIHLDHTCIHTSIYIHWTECRITNETTKSCVLCLSTCTYIQIIYVYIHVYTYIGLSVELKIKQRDFVCCVFPLVHTSGYTYIYIYWAECRFKNEMTRSCVLCLSTCTYIHPYIHLYTYIGLSVELQMKRRNLVCCVFPLVHTTRAYMYMYIYISIYIYWAERGIKNKTTNICVLCLSTCTYIQIYICLYTYIGLSVELQMK